jgi:hypothetical protein
MWTPKTVLITDPNLGDAAHGKVSCICSDLTWFSWDVNAQQPCGPPLAKIAAARWELAISFYSDLVLSPAALAAIRLPLNIHPALPRIRGVGHDLVPLVENHAEIGTTLHRMDRIVDSGEILLVHEVKLPPRQTYASLRKLNQSLCLAMLDSICAMMVEARDVPGLQRILSAHAARTPHVWGDTYYSRRMIAQMMAAARLPMPA